MDVNYVNEKNKYTISIFYYFFARAPRTGHYVVHIFFLRYVCACVGVSMITIFFFFVIYIFSLYGMIYARFRIRFLKNIRIIFPYPKKKPANISRAFVPRPRGKKTGLKSPVSIQKISDKGLKRRIFKKYL